MTTTTTIFLRSESPLPHSPILQHSPQSLAEAEAEAEAETEMFRKQAYAIRGLVYPGPARATFARGNTLLPVHKRPSMSKASTTPTTKRSKSLSAGQTVSAAPPIPPPTEDTFMSQQPSFARLIEDLLRTHSSTASPYGQHLSNSILNGTNNVYLGSF